MLDDADTACWAVRGLQNVALLREVVDHSRLAAGFWTDHQNFEFG